MLLDGRAKLLVIPEVGYMSRMGHLAKTIVVARDACQRRDLATTAPPDTTNLDTTNLDTTNLDTTNLDTPICLIYTSGTTGKPKGVITHVRGLLSYIAYGPARLHAGPGRRIAQMFSVGFDAVAAEIFGTLCYGGTLLLKHPGDMLAHLRRAHGAMMTPSFASSIDPSEFQNLDTVVFGGEAVSQLLANIWSRGRRLYNGYAPCECTVGSVFTQLHPHSEVMLGRPIPGMRAYVLSRHGELAPPGTTGEIFLSGCQVTDVYLSCEDKDQARFLSDPFYPDAMMFRTGDLGRWTNDMCLEYRGRKDRQVKMRGFRINLEEVEQALRQCSTDITHAAVLTSGGSLIAFLSPRTLGRAIDLPPNAQPAATLRGAKTDYKALAASLKSKSYSTEDAVLPHTDQLVRTVISIWSQVLDQEHHEHGGISTEDDFLLLGGHSLLLLQLAKRLSEALELKVPLSLVFGNPKLSYQ
ncbi:hypothetical protein MMC18_007517 [Xylographa bjoerkii]|nr:hypothetical protein [Xylographa bjoerkii]